MQVAVQVCRATESTTSRTLDGAHHDARDDCCHPELRHQFTHVIDVAPTILEVAGLPAPTEVHGITQRPMEGHSMAYSFDDAAPEGHETQYFELFCNRGIYSKGFFRGHQAPIPWNFGHVDLAFDDDVWELYDGSPTGPKPTIGRDATQAP